MPSYRRDRPSRPAAGPGPSHEPRSFRREEPAEDPEEERGFRRTSMFRREQGPSEFASRPVGPSERRELWEILVPESEREDPNFDYDQVFEVLRRGRGTQAPPPPPPRETPPRGEPFRPARERMIDPGLFFDMGRIWNATATLRQDPRFQRGKPVAVVRLFPEAEASREFKVSPAEVRSFLDELTYSINEVKPRELPGRFHFQTGRDGFIWLGYVE